MLHAVYRIAPTPGHAAGMALAAGLDVEFPSQATASGLRPLIEDGTFAEEELDRAVTRVLELKARLGLVPEIRPSRPIPAAPRLERHLPDDAARAVATAAVTLLANDGVLPLKRGTGKTAIVGPAADELRVHFGAYSTVSEAEMVTAVHLITTGQLPGMTVVPDVLPDLFQTRFPGIEPIFEAQTRTLHPQALTLAEAVRAVDAAVEYHAFGSLDRDEPLDVTTLEAVLHDVDIVIAVVGERTGWTGNNTAGEGRTSASPTLPGNQEKLITALHDLGKRLVTVVVTGRPLLLLPVHEASNAVVLAPLLGPMAGSVIADCLFGISDPGGRIPSTFPRHFGQVPMYHGHPAGSGYEHPTLPRPGYVDLDDNGPLYPFGHGLSYTDFDVELLSAWVEAGEITVKGFARNIGDRPGTSVVQLYARDEAASIVRPVKQLVHFRRVFLEAGQCQEIEFRVPLDRLAYTWMDGRRGLEAGDVTMMLGLSSSDIRAQTAVTVPEWLAEGASRLLPTATSVARVVA